jgi:hypothetical protein
VVAGEAADLREVAADVVAADAVRDRHFHAARPLTQPALESAARRCEHGAATGQGTDVAEAPADVGRPIGSDGRGIDVAVGDPDVLVWRWAERDRRPGHGRSDQQPRKTTSAHQDQTNRKPRQALHRTPPLRYGSPQAVAPGYCPLVLPFSTQSTGPAH